jgi:hypothetical protein
LFAAMSARSIPAFCLALGLAACNNSNGSGSTGAPPKPKSDKPAPTGSAVIKGTVKFAGAVPAPESWSGGGDANCKKLHADTVQLVKVQDGKVEDAFVYVKAGLPEGSYPTPATPVVLDQKGCEYSPRVFGIMTEQNIDVTNSDQTMHNVNAKAWNQGSTAGSKFTKSFSDEAVMQQFKCDIHPWMRAYAGVMSHPYFQTTKADGAFELKGLVDGEYTIAVWHEKLGTAEIKAKAAADAPAVEIELKGK